MSKKSGASRLLETFGIDRETQEGISKTTNEGIETLAIVGDSIFGTMADIIEAGKPWAKKAYENAGDACEMVSETLNVLMDDIEESTSSEEEESTSSPKISWSEEETERSQDLISGLKIIENTVKATGIGSPINNAVIINLSTVTQGILKKADEPFDKVMTKTLQSLRSIHVRLYSIKNPLQKGIINKLQGLVNNLQAIANITTLSPIDNIFQMDPITEKLFESVESLIDEIEKIELNRKRYQSKKGKSISVDKEVIKAFLIEGMETIQLDLQNLSNYSNSDVREMFKTASNMRQTLYSASEIDNNLIFIVNLALLHIEEILQKAAIQSLNQMVLTNLYKTINDMKKLALSAVDREKEDPIVQKIRDFFEKNEGSLGTEINGIDEIANILFKQLGEIRIDIEKNIQEQQK